MNSTILKEYADKKLQIEALKAELEALKEQAIEEIDYLKGSDREVITPFGKFSIGSKQTWKYSSDVDELAKKLSNIKKKEQSNGKAELMKDSQFPVFTPIKNEN